MKKIDITKMIYDNDLYSLERIDLLGMEFIKQKDGNYLIKNTKGIIVSEEEKLKLENKELVLEDIKCNCAKEITKKIAKNNKRLKEIQENEAIEETDKTL